MPDAYEIKFIDKNGREITTVSLTEKSLRDFYQLIGRVLPLDRS